MILPHRVPLAGAIGALVSVGMLIAAAEPQPSSTSSFPVAMRVDAGSVRATRAGRSARGDAGPATIDVADSRATVRFTLPRQAVSLLVIEW